jgi:O-antigen ligase
VFFVEGNGKERFIRVLQIILIVLAAYGGLYLLAKVTNNAGIIRIFEAVQEYVLTRDIEDAGREQLRVQAVEYFKSNPLLGIGWTNYKNLFLLRKTHVHNIYYQLLCESGIIGFAIFIFFFISSFFRTIKKIALADDESFEYSWLLLSLYIQIYFLLYGISGNPLYDIEETILYFFAVGISMLPMLDNIKQENDLRAIRHESGYSDISIRS